MNKSEQIPQFNSKLKDIFIKFISYKKLTGRKIRLYTTVLKTFDSFCEEKFPLSDRLEKETVDEFLQVSEYRKHTSVLTYASALRELGRFMKQVLLIEDAYVSSLRGSRKSSYIPYIFNEDEILRLMKSASNFSSCNDRLKPNMKNAVGCLYLLLYCTGMRVSEALALKSEDVSLEEGVILVTETKNGKQRLLPISESLRRKCHDYVTKRISHHHVYFFDSGAERNNGYIDKGTAYNYFRILLKESEISHRGKGNGPRLHDLRDSFAVHSLQKLNESGEDVNSLLEYLSLYLGHNSIYETQDYLQCH